jgi:hypothetical protein
VRRTVGAPVRPFLTPAPNRRVASPNETRGIFALSSFSKESILTLARSEEKTAGPYCSRLLSLPFAGLTPFRIFMINVASSPAGACMTT